jgi:formyl-CoA transferase
LGEPVIRRGNTHQFFAPVSVYPTKDGYAYIAVGNDRQWDALTKLSGFESLADEKYQRNAGRINDVAQLNDRMTGCTRNFTTDDLITALNQIGVPIAKVNTLIDVLNEPVLRKDFAHVKDPRTSIEVMLSPIGEVSADRVEELSFPPRLGEHNESIYASALGLNRDQIDALKNKKII